MACRRLPLPLAFLAALWAAPAAADPPAADAAEAPLRLSAPPWPFLASDGQPAPEVDPPDEGDEGDKASWLHRASEFCWDEACENVRRVGRDFKNMYLSWRLAALGAGVAVAAPLANTDADEDFQSWHRRRSRGDAADDLARCAKRFGDHWLVLPFMLGGAAVGRAFEGTPCGDALFEWGNRSWRALLVGAPAVGVLQVGLGASRPEEHASGWRPFHDKNSVAGHGFVGAVPFLTAASVARERERPLLRWAFVAGSFLTTWSRIHHDDHYLSQAILGWWIAYLSVDSVRQTDFERRRLHFTAVEYPDGVGAGVVFRY